MLSLFTPIPPLACGGTSIPELITIACIFAAPAAMLAWLIGSAFKNKTPAFWLAIAGTQTSAATLIWLIATSRGDNRLTLLAIAITAMACATVAMLTRPKWRTLSHLLAGAGPALMTGLLLHTLSSVR